MFTQLYSIHVKLIEGNVVPVLYALLPDKKASTYGRLVDVIVDSLDGYDPQAIHVDFELAMIKTLEAAFPSAGIVGCGFHFNQSLWRHIQADSDLREKYMSSDDFALEMRMFAALAYVPEEAVRERFEIVLESDFVKRNAEVLAKFLDYLEATWIGRHRHPPKMKLDWWNLYTVTICSMSRTTNSVEGWHSAFSRRLGAQHPTFSKLVKHLKAEQAKTEFTIANSQANGRAKQAKKVYRDRSKRLREIVESYPHRDPLGYLKSIAHNIRF
ncbi:uncharacterized protein LOC108865146 [Galendromus occidentalis]|uniref:Uncharacterized protein LOC108865146 n=1 Tax=Galendromus occidentalis TaxID=34638 RepID=A0AAJ7L8K0_9ACAR|nr:uncharacterized protein LOC108865146 [Galendromus occidentalis]